MCHYTLTVSWHAGILIADGYDKITNVQNTLTVRKKRTFSGTSQFTVILVVR